MAKINWLPVFAVVMTILAVGILVHDMAETPQTVIPEGYVSQADLKNAVNNGVSIALEDANSKITDLTKQITDLTSEKAVEVAEQVKESMGYLIDKIYFEDPVSEVLSDREVKKLLDTKVDFDGDEYNVEETFTIDGVEVRANEEDFNGMGYLVIPSGSLEYNVVFDSDLDTSLIGTDDEMMSFSFLGKDVEVSKWDGNEVTFSQGKEYLMDVDKPVTVEEKVVTAKLISDDSVFVDVDGVSDKIKEGRTKTINGLEIEVVSSMESSVRSVALLRMGENVKIDVTDGEEYSKDSIWEYEITNNSIGLVLKEEFTELSDDLKPLDVEGTVCLPNDYLCVKFLGVAQEDTMGISFDLDTKNSVDYVRIKGDFQSGLEDYDRLYVDRSDGKIYNDDLDEINGTITVGDSDLKLWSDGTKIHVDDDFNVKLDLTEARSGGTILDDDVDYRTVFGIWVSNPEDSIDDQEWSITVPKEQLESSITIY